MASGKGQKLSSGASVPKHAVGELIRAAACGVRASTPQAVRMALRSDENSAGGYAVPAEWVSDWVDRAVEISVLAPYASRMVMTAESSRVTTIEQRPTIATKAQLDAFGSAGIVFGSRQLQAWTSGAVMKASMEMLQDSPNAAPQIESVALRAMADWFDRTMLAGTGSAEPLGLLNREDLPGDTSAGLISWDLIGEAVAAIREEVYTANAVILSPAAYSVLHLSRELTAGDGGYLNRPEHLRDLLILQTSHCPDDQALVGDLSQLLIGIREDMRVEASATAGDAFETNAMAIRVKMRGDFVPLDLSAFYRLDAVTLS
jgi:HK97 family phage major capsid protein